MSKQQQLPLYRTCSLDANDGFFTSKLEDFLDNNTTLFFPHHHDFYQVVFFTGGTGSFTIDFENFPVAGQVYFMVPGQVHTWNFNAGVTGFIIHFSAGLIESFVKADNYLENFRFLSGYVKDQVIPVDNADIITRQMEEILSEKLPGDLVKVLLLRLFLSIQKKFSPPLSKVRQKYGAVLKKFKALVDLTVMNHRLPAEYAHELSVSLDYLNTVCRKEAQSTAGQIIRDRVIVEAKRLMINDQITMTEISNRLGFADNSNFTTFFRKYTGTTPEKFRNSISVFAAGTP